MAVLDIRQRTGWLLLVVTVGHVLLISAQVTTERGVPLIEEATLGVFTRAQGIASSAVGGIRSGWSDYFALQDVREDNARLVREMASLRVALQRERALARQSRALQELLDLRVATEPATTAAEVIAGAASPDFRTITVNKGTRDGLALDMAVLAPAGVVGRVVTPTGRASLIQLLIDRDAAAGALVERSRAQGIVVGTGTGFRLDLLPGTADIQIGDRVVTSGIEGIYPKGFLIGQIESFRRQGGEFVDVYVRPAVDFTSLETVLVVLDQPADEAE
jgi:rod shape-determining protein MreC